MRLEIKKFVVIQFDDSIVRYLFETINSFSNDTEEVSFVVEEQKIVIRNYVEPDSKT